MFAAIRHLFSRVRSPDCAPPSLSDLLDTLSRLEEGNQLAFVVRNPVLLSRARLFALGTTQPDLILDPQSSRSKAFRQCWNFIELFTEDIGKYPLGSGPLEQLLQRQCDGELSFPAAFSEAAKPGITGQLSPLYVRAFAGSARRGALSDEWRKAVKQQQLLLAALDRPAEAGEEDIEMRNVAIQSWLEIATRALNRVPDARLYRDAKRRGEELVVEARKRDDQPLLGGVLHRLGVLHTDTYISGRVAQNFEQQLKEWEYRIEDEFGPEIAASTNIRLPSAASAFAQAADYLREAANLRTGADRARTLKVLAEALTWSKFVGGMPDEKQIDSAIMEALSLFDPTQDAAVISGLRSLRKTINASTFRANGEHDKPDTAPSPKEADADTHSLALAEQLLASADEEVLNISGDPANIGLMLMQAARQLAETNILGALRVFRAVERLSRIAGLGEDYRRTFCFRATGMLTLAYRRYGFMDDASDPSTVLQKINSAAEAEKWSPPKRASAFIAAACMAASSNREELAIAMLRHAEDQDAAFWSEYQAMIDELHGNALVGAAVNALGAHQFGAAAVLYLLAFRPFQRIPSVSSAIGMLYRAADMIAETSADDLLEIIGKLALVALDAEGLGRAAIEAVQDICGKLLARMQVLRDINSTGFFLVMQIAKGLRFSEVVAIGSSYQVTRDKVARDLLDRIEQTRFQVKPVRDAKPTLLNEAALCSYVSPDQPAPGSSPKDVLLNLMHRFDMHVNDRLLADRALTLPSLQAPDKVQSALGMRTVLLNYFVAAGAGVQPVVNCLVLSSDTIDIIANVLREEPASEYGLTPGERSVRTDFLGLQAINLRSRIVEKPGNSHDVSSKGRMALAEFGSTVLSPSLRSVLEKLRRSGRDHLCVVPHRALHFCPFHLAILDDTRLLADEWIVTYTPNLRLLVTKREPASQPVAALSAFGLSFAEGGRRSHPPLPEATEEAAQIAALFGTRALVDTEATHKAILSALGTARRVHIATHGQHHVDAPSFQCVFVEGSSDADDAINAYELLGSDLRSLDLITLSACETALGRFDLSDNLRGFPANLFIAGAKTIVGTLWPIETRSSALFFVTLYKEIARGVGKLDAFRTAQLCTRAAHPELRDWGAFYLSGQWNSS